MKEAIMEGTTANHAGKGNIRLLSTYLTAICRVFPVIPGLAAETGGDINPAPAASVSTFQRFFGLEPNGEIGTETRDKIIEIYNGLPYVTPPRYPGTELYGGCTGDFVMVMQKCLNTVAAFNPAVPAVAADGAFGPRMTESTAAFQRQFGLEPSGRINKTTWDSIISAYHLILMEQRAQPYVAVPIENEPGEAQNREHFTALSATGQPGLKQNGCMMFLFPLILAAQRKRQRIKI